MSPRPITLKLVGEAFSAADDCIASLRESRFRVAHHFPLSSEHLKALSDDEEVAVHEHSGRALELMSEMLASLRQRFPDAPPRKARR